MSSPNNNPSPYADKQVLTVFSIKYIYICVACFIFICLERLSWRSSFFSLLTTSIHATTTTDIHTATLRRLEDDAGKKNIFKVDSIQDRGIAMCVGGNMVADALGVLDQIRNVHNSTLPVAIVHCEELSLEHSILFHDSFENIHLLDICEHGTAFGMHHVDMMKRLRSWYCKSAAIIRAPFKEVMVIDLDTVWFSNPDKVFDYPAYRQSGALFMRDRMTYDRPGRGFQLEIEAFVHSLNPNISITPELAAKKLSSDGVNLFWRSSAAVTLPSYNNFQDSSMLIVDRTKHPRLLATIAELLPRFALGWGDKEMYWIASIIAEEPYSFEPFLFTLYGPCGVIMHYNPNDYQHPDAAQPLYINGEWLVEKFKSIGHDLDYTMPNPILAASNSSIIDIGQLHGCACPVFGCRTMPYYINQHVLRAQWERKTRGISRTVVTSQSLATILDTLLPLSLTPFPSRPDALSYTIYNTSIGQNQTWFVDLSIGDVLQNQQKVEQALPCVLIYLPVAPEILDMNAWLQQRQDCARLGCAYTPLPIPANHPADTFCLPISFSATGPEAALLHLTMFLLSPPPKRSIGDGSVIRGTNSRQVYLMEHQVLRAFPNGDTFIHMGFEWGQIQVLHQREVDHWPKGPELPSQ